MRTKFTQSAQSPRSSPPSARSTSPKASPREPLPARAEGDAKFLPQESPRARRAWPGPGEGQLRLPSNFCLHTLLNLTPAQPSAPQRPPRRAAPNPRQLKHETFLHRAPGIRFKPLTPGPPAPAPPPSAPQTRPAPGSPSAGPRGGSAFSRSRPFPLGSRVVWTRTRQCYSCCSKWVFWTRRSRRLRVCSGAPSRGRVFRCFF